jgi:two-component system, chemotaxis family, chemotaxis protein CheY
MSPATKVRHAHRSTVRILVADADDDTRSRYGESLKRAGCDVVDAADGPDALVKAFGHRLTLVITETRLPVFDGYALCEVLRRDPMTRTVPILVVTAETRLAELQRARAAGADAILIKPVSSDALLSEIRRLLGPTAEPPEKSVAPRPVPVQSKRAVADVPNQHRRTPRAKANFNFETTTPPAPPPEIVCPSCDRPLTYERSHIGGASDRHWEQWDDYTCHGSCGTFVYRQRTRTLRAGR